MTTQIILLYIIAPIVLLITLLIIRNIVKTKRKLSEWLLEINQWEIGDTVEIKEDCDITYYCVDDNKKHISYDYYKFAKSKNPNNYAFCKLLKWNETDSFVEFGDSSKYHISTKFIEKNLTYIERTLDSGMDTFILSKKDKLLKLRNNKLVRILNENKK